MGQTAIADELQAQESERAKQWKRGLDEDIKDLTADVKLALYPVRVVDFTIKNQPKTVVGNRLVSTVGGSIDAIGIALKGGVYWVQQHPECQIKGSSTR